MIDILLVIGVSIAVIAAAFVYNYYRNKGVISDGTFKVTNDLLLFAQIIISKNLNNKTIKIEKIFELIRNNIKYIQEQENGDMIFKRELAVLQIIESLKSIGIDVDFETELLIEIVVEHGLNIIAKREEIF